MTSRLVRSDPLDGEPPPTDPRQPAILPTAAEKVLLVAIAVSFVHHVDHVLRRDHSGWPFVPDVTPFTFSLVAYPVLVGVLLLRARPWLRVGLVAVLLAATQAAHIFVETPADQYGTWATGSSTDPETYGMPNLLGVASPLLGLVAAGWSLLLSAVAVAALVLLVREARGRWQPMQRRGPRWGRPVLLLAGALLVLLATAVSVGYATTDRSYLPRVLLWQEADVRDYEKFPARVVRTAPPPFAYPTPPAASGGDPRLETVMIERDGRREERALDELLTATGTTAFLVIHDDQLVYERYFNGYDRDSTQTSFSVAKSFLSALVGIAIAEGHVSGVDAPITDYLPELRERDPRFGRITIRHLLTMSSGLRYKEGGLPFPWVGDDAKTYYAPDLRELALEGTHVEGEPGRRFEYNNYHPLLLGLILERATGRSVAQYLEEKLWRPLGMEADGSWSLDSDASGFEKLESGINGRATDFAKFGSLYLHGGEWRGRQLIPRGWVEESTRGHAAVEPAAAATGYGYFWWVGEGGHYAARGNHGQLIFVAPDKGVVIVRFGTRVGREGGNPDWIRTFEELVARFDGPAARGALPSPAGAASSTGLTAGFGDPAGRNPGAAFLIRGPFSDRQLVIEKVTLWTMVTAKLRSTPWASATQGRSPRARRQAWRRGRRGVAAENRALAISVLMGRRPGP